MGVLRFKNNYVEKVKRSHLFMRGDVLIYLFVMVVVLGLFLFPLFNNGAGDSNGFCVWVKDQKAVTFLNGELTVSKEFINFTETNKTQEGYLVKLFTQDKKGFNLIFFDAENRSVKMIESTCSSSKDCVHFPALKDNGAIYCAPHQVKITLLESDGFTPPVAGGI